MTVFSKLNLSGGNGNGRGIKVSATATPGTIIHTCSGNAAEQDEIYLYAYNSGTVDVLVTIEFGGTTSPDDNIAASIPPKSGLFALVPGICLQGNATPLVVRAFAATADAIVITGFVNRIQQ